MSTTRQLAAIMFTDIVGYTALMQHDEQIALEKLHLFKEELNEKVNNAGGQIIQYYGDGCLAIFNNPTDAVHCAKKLQEIFSQKHQVPVRIGIHLGEILIEDGNIFGDSVNIAARIQSMSVPGGVLFSDGIKNQIKNKPEFQFTSVGRFEFKNVDEQMEVFALANPGFSFPDKSLLVGKFKETERREKSQPLRRSKYKKIVFTVLGSIALMTVVYFTIKSKSTDEINTTLSNADSALHIRSIAVLPFDDYSPKKDQAWFTDGMTDALITELSKISSLNVRSRTSVMQYKGTTKTIPEIAKELNVDAVIEGSALKSGDSVRITAQLLNSQDKHLWANDFDAGMKDVLQVHHHIAQAITKGINIILTPADMARFTNPIKVNPVALEADLKGFKLFMEVQKVEQLREAVSYFKKAIEIDSTYAKGYAHLAAAYLTYPYYCEKTPMEALQLAENINNTALKSDSQLTQAWLNKFTYLYFIKWDWKEALLVLPKIQSLSLNDPLVIRNLLNYYVMTGKFDKAFETCEFTRHNYPGEPIFWENLIFTQFHSRDLEGVVRSSQEALKIFPDNGRILELKSWALSLLGRHEEAVINIRKVLSLVLQSNPMRHGEAGCIFARAGLKKEAIKELNIIQKLDLKYIDPVSIGLVYMGLRDKDKAMDYFQKAYNIHSFWLSVLKRAPTFDAMRDDPRFQKLILDLKFP